MEYSDTNWKLIEKFKIEPYYNLTVMFEKIL